MKKLLMTFFILTLIMTAVPVWAETGDVLNAEKIKLIVICDEKGLSCKNDAIRMGDLTYLPLREIMEFYGVNLGWATGEAEDKVILITDRERCQLVLDLENSVAHGLNGVTYPLKHENSIVYLPIHFYFNAYL